MNVFFLELWHDLREKRLWPVALGLLLALIAIPVFLMKPAEDSGGATDAASVPAPQEEGPKILAAETTPEGSKLQAFKGSNPFKSLVARRNETESSTVTSGSESVTSGGSGGGKGELTISGGGLGGGTTQPKPQPTVAYTYVVDVTFGRLGRARRIDGLRRLEMLPNAETPLLVFLGVDSTADNGVFLVDSTLKQAGEGRCADSACSVMSLGSGSEHLFTTEDGREYVLRIEQIRKVRVRNASSARREKASAVSTSDAKSRNRADESARAIVSSLLVDIETAASTDAGASSSERDHR